MKDRDTKRLASFPELNPNPILELNSAGKITYINQAAERRFPDLARLKLKHPLLTDFKSIFKKFEREKTGSFAREVEVDTSVYYQAIYYVPKDELVRIFNHDITAEKRAEEALRHALKESERRSREISALLQATSQVLKYQEFENAARSVFDSCKNLIGATAGYIALLSEEGAENEVLFLDSGGLPCTVDPSLTMPIRGLRAEAYKTGKAVYENDFARSQWLKYMPPGHVGLRNVLFAPLNIEGKTVGLLGLANKESDFIENDARTASAFGELVSLALQNSRLLESLKESEEHLKFQADMLAQVSEAVIAIDNDNRVTYWNRAAEKLYGLKSEEMLGQKLQESHRWRWLKPEDEKTANQSLAKNGSWHGENIQVKKDGDEIHVESSVSVIMDGSGNVLGQLAVVRDISERKWTENEIKRLNKVLERHIIERTAQLDSANKELEKQITRRKWTEEELRKSLNKIREILGSPINPTSGS